VTTCAWTLRDGMPCRKLAQVDGLCPPHFNLRRALEAEDAERALRGEPPMGARERDGFLSASAEHGRPPSGAPSRSPRECLGYLYEPCGAVGMP
jgi:hypothetical protein